MPDYDCQFKKVLTDLDFLRKPLDYAMNSCSVCSRFKRDITRAHDGLNIGSHTYLLAGIANETYQLKNHVQSELNMFEELNTLKFS